MKKEISVLIVLIAIFSLVLVLPARAALSSVTATPSDSYGSHTVNYTIGFTSASTTPANGKVRLTFPGAFTTTNAATSTTLTGFDGIIASLSVMVLQRADGSDHAGGAVTVGVNTIVNPIAGGSFTVVVETLGAASDVFETGTSAAFSIVACCQSPSFPSDTTPPISKITSPTEGLTITAGKKYVIEGTGADVGGSTIKSVEVSLDGGKSWSIAQSSVAGGNFSWQYVWENPLAGEYVIQVRATDSKGNRESPSAGKKVTVATPAVVPPAVSPEKPITEMTVSELEAKVIEVQQKIIDILQQLIQILQQRIQELQA